MSTLAYGLNYLSTSWADLGRPTVTLILSSRMLGNRNNICRPSSDRSFKNKKCPYRYSTISLLFLKIKFSRERECITRQEYRYINNTIFPSQSLRENKVESISLYWTTKNIKFN